MWRCSLRMRLIPIVVSIPFILAYSQDSGQVQELQELDIRYAAELNHVPVGCRTIAMGNTGVTLPYNDMNIYWNPAAISFSENYEISIEGAKLYGGLSSLGVLSFNAPVQNGLSTGILYKVFFPDLINEWDSLPGTLFDRQYNYSIDGYPAKGVFHNNQHSINASLAKRFSIPIPRPSSFSLPIPVDIAVGLNIKSLIMTMTPGTTVRMGYNINLDVGMLFRIGVDYNLDEETIRREVLMAASFKDVLPTKMTWLHSYEDYEEPVDIAQSYGMAYIDRSGFLFGDWTVSLALYRQYDISFHAGLEGDFFDIVAFRAGVSNKIVTLGAGVHYKNYSVDYTFTFDEIDYSLLRMSAGVKFNRKK